MNEGREIDWINELIKQAPLLACGLLLILSAATGVTPGFGAVQQAWQGILGVVGALLVLAGVVFLFRVQQVGGQALSNDTAGDTSSNGRKLRFFATNYQTTELVSREDGLELVFHDIREPQKFRRQFLGQDALRDILQSGRIKVVPKSSRSPKWGVLTIGPWSNWLYSKELHPNPKDLYVAIYDLIGAIIQRNDDRRKS